MNEKFIVRKGQLDHICEALDAVMIAEYILRQDDPLVDSEPLASLLSLAYSAISEVVDDIINRRGKEAQA